MSLTVSEFIRAAVMEKGDKVKVLSKILKC
jgi:hypothetical protein